MYGSKKFTIPLSIDFCKVFNKVWKPPEPILTKCSECLKEGDVFWRIYRITKRKLVSFYLFRVFFKSEETLFWTHL